MVLEPLFKDASNHKFVYQAKNRKVIQNVLVEDFKRESNMLSKVTKGILFAARASAKSVCNVAFFAADTVQAGASALDSLAGGDYETSKGVIFKSLSQMSAGFEQTIDDTNQLIEAALSPDKEFLTSENADHVASLVPLGLIAAGVVFMFSDDNQEEN